MDQAGASERLRDLPPPLDSPPPHEVAIGMARYLTTGPGTGGRTKLVAEDFVVDEVPLPFTPARGEGKYTIAALRVRNWETNRLMREVAYQLRIAPNAIFFAGTKDKRAITTQYVAIPASINEVRALDLPDVEVLETRRADRAPKIGELLGNRFEIALRGLAVPLPEAEARARGIVAEIVAQGGFPNYFGVQRFGVQRPVTHVVGKALVAGDLEGAVMAYIGNPMDSEDDDTRLARAELERTRDFAAAEATYPSKLGFERAMIRSLAEYPDDWERAILTLPRNLVTMFVYAHQSILFNKMISARIAAGLPLNEPVEGDICLGVTSDGTPDRGTVIPVSARNLEKMKRQTARGRAFVSAVLFGTASTYAEGVPGEIERRVIEESGVTAESFHVQCLPEAASSGTRREILTPVDEISVRAEVDAISDKIVLGFFLPKGAYATCLVREVAKTATIG